MVSTPVTQGDPNDEEAKHLNNKALTLNMEGANSTNITPSLEINMKASLS